jgi:hypothetical protein
VLDAAGKIVRNLVDITPAPIFARLDGTDDGMAGRVIVLGGVPVLGGIAASDMAAKQAKPEMDPGVAGLHAIFADMTSRLEIARLRDVGAVCHRVVLFQCVDAGNAEFVQSIFEYSETKVFR